MKLTARPEAGRLQRVRINPPENAKLTFDLVVADRMQEMIETNFKFYKQFTDDEAFAGRLLEALFERYREAAT